MTLKQAYSRSLESARCVQRFDDSRSAIRITYRISLRSSSSQEPRYPLLKVVDIWGWVRVAARPGLPMAGALVGASARGLVM